MWLKCHLERKAGQFVSNFLWQTICRLQGHQNKPKPAGLQLMLCRKQLQKAAQPGVRSLSAAVLSFIRESRFYARLTCLSCPETGEEGQLLSVTPSVVSFLTDLEVALQRGKRLCVPRWRLKGAFLTLTFKTALGTRMIGQLWRWVVSCPVTSFIFNYIL